jgi:hypothetical protein
MEEEEMERAREAEDELKKKKDHLRSVRDLLQPLDHIKLEERRK